MVVAFGRGLREEFSKRRAFYVSDWRDGLVGTGTLPKLLATISFLYFSCMLPTIAFGALNETQTNGAFSVASTIVSQGIGGICFALFAAQPLVVLLSTAPLALFIRIAFSISRNYDIEFANLYTWIGIFNALFLILYSVTNLADIFLHLSSPFLEETFSLFITIALAVDALTALFDQYSANFVPGTRDIPLLWTVLLLGTAYVGVTIGSCRRSRVLTASIRHSISDSALTLSVLSMSFVGSYLLSDVGLTKFHSEPNVDIALNADFSSGKTIAFAIPLGFALSLLFFMDQSISAAMVHARANRLQKGVYYHWDIMLVALINLALSLMGIPWIHGALPWSPMHAVSLADTDSRFRVVRARETRLATLVAHILIIVSLVLLPLPLELIPMPVLFGCFLFMSLSSVGNNHFWHRILLLISWDGPPKPADNPDNDEDEEHEVLSPAVLAVPSRTRTKFTLAQMCCLGALCAVGFAPEPLVRMCFPVLLAALMAVRSRLLKYIVPAADLDVLDVPGGAHVFSDDTSPAPALASVPALGLSAPAEPEPDIADDGEQHSSALPLSPLSPLVKPGSPDSASSPV